MERVGAERQAPARAVTRRSLLRRLVVYPVAGMMGVAGAGAVYSTATRYRGGRPHRGQLALTGATVLAGAELRPVADTTVLVRDGTVVAVGDVDVPTQVEALDLRGRTLVPGLIDVHVHLGSPGRDQGPGPLAIAGNVIDWFRFVPGRRRSLLEHGVTTVRSLGDDLGWITDMRRKLAEGELEGPRLLAAGPVFTAPGGHPVATFGADPASDGVRVPTTPREARDAVRQLAGGDATVDVIKVVQDRGGRRRALEPIAPGVLNAIAAEAHELGLAVEAHWGTEQDLREVIAAGVDGLQHIEPRGTPEGWPAELLDTLIEQGVSLTPTLSVTDDAIAVSAEVHRQLRRRVADFHAAGGRVAVGSDSPMQGVPFGAGVHRELQLLVECGLTPQAALRAATSDAATVVDRPDIGAIEPGRAADLVVVDGDPIDEIRAIRNIVMVFRDGRLVVDRRQ